MDERKKNIIDLDRARDAMREKNEREELTTLRTDEEEKPDAPKRKKGMAAALAVILVIVFAVVLVAAFWDKLNIDALRRIVTYGGANQSETAENGAFEYEDAASECFASLGDDLVILTNNSVSVRDRDGKTLFTCDVQMNDPVLDVGKDKAVAYDVGGSSLVVFDAKEQCLKLTLDKNLAFISASLNDSDYLAVTAQKSGEKGCVSVYDSNMNLVFEFNSSQRYVMNACVTADCSYLVAETLGQSDGSYISEMAVYKLKSGEQLSSLTVSGGMVLDLGSIGAQTAALADDRLAIASAQTGEIGATYTFNTEYLRGYSLAGDGFAALLLNRYRAGSVARIATVGSDGAEIASLDINDEVLDISAKGRYIAVLYSDKLVIYTKYMDEYATLTDTGYAKYVCMRADGSAWLVGSGSAKLIVP
ncbi:MAG: DUF5711 family protein [Oscillospiraceae bacterium]|nr:DUF5711 family protein [Oscillospiraceae bacterium]